MDEGSGGVSPITMGRPTVEEIQRLVERERKQRECLHRQLRLPEDDYQRIVRRYVECADCGMCVGARMQRVETLCLKCSNLPITKWYPIVTKLVFVNAYFLRLVCPRCHETSVVHRYLPIDEDDPGLEIYTETEWARVKEEKGFEDEDVEWKGEVPEEKFDHVRYVAKLRERGMNVPDDLDSEYDGKRF